MTSLFSSPSGWHNGGTSFDTIADVNALPPRPAYSPTGTAVALGPPSAPTLILRILSIISSHSLAGFKTGFLTLYRFPNVYRSSDE